MLNSLFGRLALTQFAIILALAALLMAVSRDSHVGFQQSVEQQLNRDLAARVVQAFPLVGRDGPDPAMAERLFHDLMVLNPFIEVYLLDTQGRPLAYSAPPGHVRRSRVDLAPIKRFLGGDHAYPLLGDDPRDLSGKKPFSVAPVAVDDQVAAYLYVVLGSETQDAIATATRPDYQLAVALGLAGALLVALVSFAWLTLRLRRLSRDLASAHPDLMTAHRGDELDRLARGFVGMTARIRHQLSGLRQQDRHRRELVANISHDLRTPLTSLHGYLETLALDAGELSAAQRRACLTAARAGSEQLIGMVDQLFELARLDDPAARAQLAPLDLPRLLGERHTAHLLAAREAGVRLRLELPRQLPAAQGDRLLLQRLIDNLLGNALRHCRPGDWVRLAATQQGDRVQLVIQDNGAGMTADAGTRLFDREWQACDDGPGPLRVRGLGLAIVQRIAELHGTALQLQTAPGTGTCFSIQLAASTVSDPATSRAPAGACPAPSC